MNGPATMRGGRRLHGASRLVGGMQGSNWLPALGFWLLEVLCIILWFRKLIPVAVLHFGAYGAWQRLGYSASDAK